ncbi:MAG: DDE-type integrase/transposase/recombinase [Verrucomicrobiota bacterium]
MNDKRVQRIWREDGLKLARRQRKRARMGNSEQGSQRLRAEHPNHVGGQHFVQDWTRDGQRLKRLGVVDEYTRECLVIHVARRIDAAQVMKVIEGLVCERGAPGHLRSDHGPEFVAMALSAEWRRDSNEARPHSALGDQMPAEFAKRCRARVGATPLPSHDSAHPQPNLS